MRRETKQLMQVSRWSLFIGRAPMSGEIAMVGCLGRFMDAKRAMSPPTVPAVTTRRSPISQATQSMLSMRRSVIRTDLRKEHISQKMTALVWNQHDQLMVQNKAGSASTIHEAKGVAASEEFSANLECMRLNKDQRATMLIHRRCRMDHILCQ